MEQVQRSQVTHDADLSQTKPEVNIVPKVTKPKKKRKWLKRLITLVVIAAVVVFVVYQLGQGASSMVASSYYPQTVTTRDMTITVSGTGTIAPLDTYQVTAMVSGEILEAPFQEGDVVEKGDLLFFVDSGDMDTTIAQQEIAVQQAQLNYDTYLKNQSDSLENLEIEANGTGVVTKVYVEEGDTIAAGTPIADVLDRDTMEITLPFHGVYADAFYEGQVASVYVEGYSTALAGVVESIAVVDIVGDGGTVVREVTISVANPGVISNTTVGTASIGLYDCTSSGTFAYGESCQVVALNSGEIVSLTIGEGDRVTDGQVIGAFDATDMDNTIESARLSVETALLSYNSVLDTLEDYTITAPISGTIVDMNYKAGDDYDPTINYTYMALIYDMSALEFEMAIDELDINAVAVGQTVEFTTDAVEGVTFYGTVTSIGVNGTTAGGYTTYPATVSVSEGEGLLPGMNVSADIIVEEVGDVLTVPVDAVARGNTVTVAAEGALGEDGLSVIDLSKLYEVDVTLGQSNDIYVEITSGLEEGDVVVVQSDSSSLIDAMNENMPSGGF